VEWGTIPEEVRARRSAGFVFQILRFFEIVDRLEMPQVPFACHSEPIAALNGQLSEESVQFRSG
jgi:hypothetical protein